ncbi:MAG: hypothetical protein IKU45_03100 [Clostridia bacterium]|nr:hypothetical protein [Clostridia bacterium]
MRELNEYKKEIFALGEKKIKERKKKIIKSMAICMPLCVCLVIFGIHVMPAFIRADKAAPELNEEMDLIGSTDNGYDDAFSQYSATVNTPDGVVMRIIDEDTKERLMNVLAVDDGTSDIEEETIVDETLSAEMVETESAENKHKTYLFKITFEYENGEKIVYVVNVNSIIDGDGFVTKISQEKLDEIKKILGKE